jgi:hypothetical protein
LVNKLDEKIVSESAIAFVFATASDRSTVPYEEGDRFSWIGRDAMRVIVSACAEVGDRFF